MKRGARWALRGGIALGVLALVVLAVRGWVVPRVIASRLRAQFHGQGGAGTHGIRPRRIDDQSPARVRQEQCGAGAKRALDGFIADVDDLLHLLHQLQVGGHPRVRVKPVLDRAVPFIYSHRTTVQPTGRARNPRRPPIVKSLTQFCFKNFRAIMI